MISAVDQVRLHALLAMLGSDQMGERDNAARLIDQFRRQKGFNWADLLAGRGLATVAPDHSIRRPQPESAAAQPRLDPPIVIRPPDTMWRWSMTVGLIVVTLISITTLVQQYATGQKIESKLALEAGCPPTTQFGNWPTCATTPRSANGSKPQAAVAATTFETPALRSFEQGRTDRKLWSNWHKSSAASLCSAHLRTDQTELQTACATAAKLLEKFDQLKRTDPEYKRGWNSLQS